jgi:hypothetical protein
MHREVMGLMHGDPLQVDHRDRVNTLDNRRKNLRVTHKRNQQNQGKSVANTSGFKGVSLRRATTKNRERSDTWQAQIGVEGKVIHLGYFQTRELAASTYDAAALKYHGEFAVTNRMLGLL